MNNKNNEDLWYQISENLTELSRRDGIKYRVNVTSDSLARKLEKLKHG